MKRIVSSIPLNTIIISGMVVLPISLVICGFTLDAVYLASMFIMYFVCVQLILKYFEFPLVKE